ncbi:MAG: ABC transporter substrate-binding protein [Acidimicrobiia bacterium]
MVEDPGRYASRRDFLRLTAGGAAVAALGGACSSGSDKPKAGSTADSGSKGRETLRIVQWSHFVPAYDAWFDGEYITRWGEEHDVDVTVDHVPLEEQQGRADAELATGRGHDIFGFTAPPPAYEDSAIDHREIVEEVVGKLGPMTPLVERSVLNPKTGKYFGFPEYWAPMTVQYRLDLWSRVQSTPDSWEDVLGAGAPLKGMGNPLGLGISEDFDATASLLGLMHAYGASIQDEGGSIVVNRPATVEAVKMGAAIFKAGMTDEVLTWDAASNNRFLAGGKGSLIFNPVSSLRAVEKQDPELAKQIGLLAVPSGPAGRFGAHSVSGTYVIWKFSEVQDIAKQFLVDLALNYREAFVRSESYNLPAFPGSVPDLSTVLAADTTAQPAGKYAFLAGAAEWSTNLGHPGFTNAGVNDVANRFLIPRMFAAAARGEMSAEDAVKAAEAQITPLFDKWRAQGKI